MVVRNVTAMKILDQSFIYSSDDALVGSMVSVECFIGFWMIFAVIVGCHRIPAMRSPFGILMMNQNITQLIACLTSGSFFFLGVLLNIKVVLDHSNYFGNFTICLLPVVIGSFFLMSLNRFCASTMVFTYKTIFSNENIRRFIIFNWAFSGVFWAWVILSRECNFVFFHYGWIFTGDVYTEICRDLIITYNTVVQLTMTSLIFVLDVATLCILVCGRGRVYKKQSASVRKREMSFAGQVLIQGIVFFMHGFWYDMGYSWLPGNDERWKYFFTTSFSSNLLHTFDPLIVFLFNPEFRRWIIRFHHSAFKKNQVTAVSAISS
ncbi:hypothetical protein GCK72_019766 [Caenorhabditis remanei]|uniref:7TM GPCR serpentine receptor class x (Srx) domain-containing protein n=1 Tax=Caenorhabditis remanei TaxID=31234 RepID=A0A6A5GDQ7_CAERE|nr:hypothetical protein GCK72_019766 [Caenorhabditis remanei]KAF1753210.1 hypothetical protein GCK72_019766 [Caenorhabditis remanei]